LNNCDQARYEEDCRDDVGPGGIYQNYLTLLSAWQLLNQLGSKILLRFPFVIGRREAGFDCPDFWHSPISVWQLPKSLLAENLLQKQLVDTGVKTLPK
jgi:hypothetical protein